MRDLRQTLHDQDLGFLNIVAELWDIDWQPGGAQHRLAELIQLITDPDRIRALANRLPPEARQALADLISNGGRLPWVLFTRRYGEVREMGSGRRDRERPDRQPISPAERLWYHGLIGKGFWDTTEGPQELAYIPSDFLPWLDISTKPTPGGYGRKARSAEIQTVWSATDHILDHACTLLAAVRAGFTPQELDCLAEAWQAGANRPYPVPLSIAALSKLLETAGLLEPAGSPFPEAIRQFLEASRGEALLMLVNSWMASNTFNELRLVPGLAFEGVWQNDPLHARQEIYAFTASAPAGAWWHLPELVKAVRTQRPDFQRPAGDYDSWYIRSQASGEFLRGYKHWEAVDGALIRFTILGPMYWLGLLELAAPAEDQPPVAFRFSPWAVSLLSGKAPDLLEENGEVRMRSDAHFSIPRLSPRTLRYQLARFAAWDGFDGENYRYHLTAHTLEVALQQGLQPSQLLGLIRRNVSALPPSLVKALERWSKSGTEARIERAVILRLRTPELLQTIRESRAARFLGDPLGPTVITVKPGAEEKVLAILAELGYLGESQIEG